MTTKYTLHPGTLCIETLRQVHRRHVPIVLAPESFAAINMAEQTVQNVITQGRTVYGINTGFGLLANTKIEVDELELLQRSI
ncbi:MAG: aromatic amino acid lyase, partial [Paraglaciecola chathamensis]